MYSAAIQAVSVECDGRGNRNPTVYSLFGPDIPTIYYAFAALHLKYKQKHIRDALALELQSCIDTAGSERKHFKVQCGHDGAGYWIRAGPTPSAAAENDGRPPLILKYKNICYFKPDSGFYLAASTRHRVEDGLAEAPPCDGATEISTATPDDDPAFEGHECGAGYLLEIEDHIQEYVMRCNGLIVWKLEPESINFLRSFGISRLPTWVCPKRGEVQISAE